MAAKGVGCCGVSVGGDATLLLELFSHRGWGEPFRTVGLLLFYICGI